MTFTKSDMIDHLAAKHGVGKKQAAHMLRAFLDSITKELTRGANVSLPGLGKLVLKDKHQRMGRNPQTGEPIIIAARRVVTFKVSSVLSRKLKRLHTRDDAAASLCA